MFEQSKQYATDKLKSIIDNTDNLKNAKNDSERMEILERIIDVLQEFHITRGYCLPLSNYNFPLRLIGLLDDNNEPKTAELQYTNRWHTWETLDVGVEKENILIEFARQFNYSE